MEQPPSYVAQGETKVCHLKKTIYGLKQSSRAWFEKFSLTISGTDFYRCHSDHFVFVRRTKSGIIILVVYVDNILLTSGDSAGLLETKKYLKRHFVTQDMRRPNYFLGIEVAHQKHSVLLSQRKYALNLLEEAGLLGCKPTNTPMEANVNLWFDDSHTLDPGRYRRLIRKLINLTVTRSDITFVVGVLSRFMHQPRETNWLGDRKSTTEYCIFVGANLVT